ncbi:MAG: ABC transporter ATP-binding protein [Saprospiraceae bacterium]
MSFITGFFKHFKSLHNIPRFFAMIWQVAPGMAFANALLRLLQAAFPVVTLYIGKLIIDQILHLVKFPPSELSFESTKYLWALVGLELGIVVINNILSRAITLLDSLLGDLISNDSSLKIIRHAATLDLFQFENPTFYDKLERARMQTSGRTALMSLVLGQLQDTLSMLFLLGGLTAFNPWLLLLMLLAVIPSFLGETHFNKRSYSLTHSWTPERRELDYLRFIGASDQSAKEIKIFGLETFIAERFERISRQYYKANEKLAIQRSVWGSLFTIVGIAAYYGAYIYIIYQALIQVITIGTLTFLAGSFQRMQGLLQGVVSRFSRVAEMSLYLQDYFDFLAIKPLIAPSGQMLKVPQPIKLGFEFDNVSFKYPNSERWAIRNLSFVLHPGEKLALVGENGAGKTTIVKLLAHLYEPIEGQILLDGVALKNYDPVDLRREIGVIFQDYVRYDFTASENIAIGNIDERNNQALLEAAADQSLANEVIRDLPLGFQQMLGKRFKTGVDLSGGQWQKIALARAFMREAQLVILDEPTASLDARAEHEVFTRFSALMQERMAVLISHRFSTVRMADRILFLEQGQLLELGSHEELMLKKGKYAELFSLQAKGYL